MKRFILILIVFLAVNCLQAQQKVTLKINHKLGNSDFEHEKGTSNNLNNVFSFTRLEYYISQIKLIHDSGKITTVPNRWILINAENSNIELLGNFSINQLEGITFSIGVEDSVNHLDPSDYPIFHPLAPKSPSMHWGWAAGYRFIALEGLTGSSMNNVFQIHALGDTNYFSQTVVIKDTISNGEILIQIDADYSKALENIVVDDNLIYHGEYAEAMALIKNFNNKVFSPTVVNINERINANSFSIYPNPSKGSTNIQFERPMQDVHYRVLNMLGSEISSGQLNYGNTNKLSIETKGIFLLQFFVMDQFIGSRKLIIQ